MLDWPGLSLAGGGLAERGLGGGEARDRHAERRAGHVVELHLVAERDRGGIAAVLAADSDLELRLDLAAALDADPHELAYAVAVDGDERIDRHDPARHVGAEETRSIVARNAEGRLREVVGAERKERRALGDLASA